MDQVRKWAAQNAQHTAAANFLPPGSYGTGIAPWMPLALTLAHIRRQQQEYNRNRWMRALGALGQMAGQYGPMLAQSGGGPGGGGAAPMQQFAPGTPSMMGPQQNYAAFAPQLGAYQGHGMNDANPYARYYNPFAGLMGGGGYGGGGYGF